MGLVKRICHLVLRFLAFGATLSSVIVMATTHERLGFSFFPFYYEAKYTNTPAFRYFVIANSVVTVYGFFVMFLPPKSLLWRFVVALDLVFTMLLISSESAAVSIAYVGKKGNVYAGWLPICGQVRDYCNHVTGALIAGLAAVVIYVILLLYSIHTVLDPLLLTKTGGCPHY
ncbi:CASP-like protein 1C2 [Neltuma alba]|uniref:CASP-like protein 1C2 n=1 Tax=Neltuma alba TaxID=207710 RepID=UPI0010A3203B|nr:CASP-like protein 1C2 [Prosopis alba]XP_028807891.1 CASP-like protein 1C2 [Prosopis alba]